MPNIKSAEKRMRSDEVKRLRNQATTSELKNLSKKLTTLSNEPAKAKELAEKLIVRYDKAVHRGVIPRARADRRKSRITNFVNKIRTEKHK